MKILLGENLPKKLKVSLGENSEVFTVNDMSWNVKQNGELLQLLEENNFEVLLTIDKNLQYQQNLDKHSVKIIILNAPNNKIETLTPYIEKLNIKLQDDGITERIVIIDEDN